MWNPLSPAEVVAAMGSPVREAARAVEPLGEWQSGQLLSVYSGTRHLAAELAGVEPHVSDFCSELAAALRSAPAELPQAAQLAELAARLEGLSDPRQAAEIACQALDLLRGDDSGSPQCVRQAVQLALKHAVQLEVRVLADAIEGPVKA